MQINTVNEQDAYDKGFADGKDYWGPLERDRAIKLLIDKAIEWRTADLHQQASYIDFAIALIKGEEK